MTNIPTRAYFSEAGILAFCQTTGQAVRPENVQFDGYALWFLCPLCVRGAKFGDFKPQPHCVVWLREAK